MSHVTSIVLITATEDGAEADDEHPNVDQLNSFFQNNGHAQGIQMSQVDSYAGGGKVMGCDVFMAGINHLNTDEFLEAFYSIQWEAPEYVQLMLKDEHDERFTTYEPKI